MKPKWRQYFADRPGKAWLTQIRTSIRRDELPDDEAEEILAQRYPNGWQRFLNDPGIVCELVRKVMAAKGEVSKDMNLTASMIDEIEAAHCSCGAMDAKYRSKTLPAWWAYCELHNRCDALRRQLGLAQYGRALAYAPQEIQ